MGIVSINLKMALSYGSDRMERYFVFPTSYMILTGNRLRGFELV